MTDFTEQVNLADRRLGAGVVAASDEFFGEKENLLRSGPPASQPGTFGHKGQVVDGWETRRRRGPGHDWCIVRLARRGVIERVELETDHYKGNAPGHAMLEYTDSPSSNVAKVRWRTLVSRAPLEPHARHRWETRKGALASHVRLNIYPDGGVSRLRLFGQISE